MSERLPELLDAKKLSAELGVTRAAAEVGGLVDLRGFDLWRRFSADASDTRTDRTAANEAHDFNDVADVRKVLAAVLVEPVNGVRGIPRDERHGVGPHLRTMAGRR